jgi:AhpD family alkylhydroperoxidase
MPTAAIGSNSPVALEAALNLDGALRKSSLSAKEIEVVKLAVSQQALCDYCLAAHTLMGGKAGLRRRHPGRAPQPADRRRAPRCAGQLCARVVSTSGDVPAEVVLAVKQAGYSDAQIVDTLLAVASITFTNLFNRVNVTALDFRARPNHSCAGGSAAPRWCG